MVEGYANPTTLNGTAGNSAPVGGRRRSVKGVRKVSAKKIRATLRALKMKPKGRVVLKGGDVPAAAEAAEQTPGMVAATKLQAAPRSQVLATAPQPPHLAAMLAALPTRRSHRTPFPMGLAAGTAAQAAYHKPGGRL